MTIDSELIERLKEVNASATVNNLLREFFNDANSEDIDVLKSKLPELMSERRQITAKIRHFKAKIGVIQAKKDAEKTKNLDKKAKEEREKLVMVMKSKWQREEITDEEFYAFCDNLK